MADEPTPQQRLERAAEGLCPECGSDFSDHCMIAFEHGHGAAEASDILRHSLAEQAGVDPHDVQMQYTDMGNGLADVNLYMPFTGKSPEEISEIMRKFTQHHGKHIPGQPPMVGGPMPMAVTPIYEQVAAETRQRLATRGPNPALIAIGALSALFLGGFMAGLWVVDRMVKQLVRSFPHWNQD